MSTFKGRKPVYRLSVKTRDGEEPSGQGVIGSGWSEPDGSITIRLNPCVVLRFEDNLLIKLFPTERAAYERTGAPQRDDTLSNDDTPF